MFENISLYKAYSDIRFLELKNKEKNTKSVKETLKEQIVQQKEFIRKFEVTLKGLDEESITNLTLKYKKPYEQVESSKAKKKILKDFRSELSDILIEKNFWRKDIAWVAKFFANPGEPKKTEGFLDYVLAGEGVGHLPTMYLNPINQMQKRKNNFNTKVNLIYDLSMTAVAYGLTKIIPEANDAVSNNIPYISDVFNYFSGYFDFMAKAALYTKIPQTPYRWYMFIKKGEHTAAPSSIFHFNPIQAGANLYLFANDWIIAARHQIAKYRLRKLENKLDSLNTSYSDDIKLEAQTKTTKFLNEVSKQYIS